MVVRVLLLWGTFHCGGVLFIRVGLSGRGYYNCIYGTVTGVTKSKRLLDMTRRVWPVSEFHTLYSGVCATCRYGRTGAHGESGLSAERT